MESPFSHFAAGKKILGPVAASPADGNWVYQSSRLFQLSGDTVGLMTQIRPGGVAAVDVSCGNDLWVFSDPEARDLTGPTLIDRADRCIDGKDGQEVYLSVHWSKGAFVPLGAKRADGSPHPAAGTGFGGSTAVGYPTGFSVQPKEILEQLENYIPQRGIENPLGTKSLALNPDPLVIRRVHQYRYDGRQFHIERIDPFLPEGFAAWPGHSVWGLGGGIPDGDDLLFPLTLCETGDTVARCGIARWRYDGSGWGMARFTPVPGAEHCFEPSVERDGSGDLFLTCRSANNRPAANSIRVWRSADGIDWRLCIDQPDVRSSSPVTISRTVDGQPFILGNPFEKGGNSRDRLAAWPLAADRESLLPMTVLLDSERQYGLLGGKYGWYLDHPVGEVVRLADGQWHSLFTHRFANRMEISYDCPPTQLTGTCLGKSFSTGDPVPRWNF